PRRSEIITVSALAVASLTAAWIVRPTGSGLLVSERLQDLSVAIPMTWACLFLYAPVRLAASWAWREVERAAPRIEDRRALGLVLLLGFGLMIWGLEWGLMD